MLIFASLLLVSLTLPAHIPSAQTQAPVIGQVSKIAGTSPEWLSAATACGAYERAENTAWTKIPGIDAMGILDLVQLKDGTILASFGGDIYRRPPGEAWQLVADLDTPMTASGFVNLATSPVQTRVYYLAGNSVAYVGRSDDSGRTWQQPTVPNGAGSESYPGDIAVLTDPTRGQDVVLMTFGLPGCGAVTPYTGIPQFTDTPTRRYFYETSHSLSNEFKRFGSVMASCRSLAIPSARSSPRPTST